MAREDALKTLQVFGFGRALNHFARQGRFAQRVERFLELFVFPVIEEAQRAAAAGGVVDHLATIELSSPK